MNHSPLFSDTFPPQRPLFCCRREQISTLELLVQQVWLQTPPTSGDSVRPTLMPQVGFPPNAYSLRSLLIAREALRAICNEHGNLYIWFLVHCLSLQLNHELYEDKKPGFYSSKLCASTVCLTHKQGTKLERMKLKLCTEMCVGVR